MDQVTEPVLPSLKPKKKSHVVLFFLSSLFLVCLFSFLRFYVFKNYNIIIETECNPEKGNCFTRGCETGECPPNGLSNYKKYIIKRSQFDKCDHVGSCAKFCSNIKNCEPIECDTESGDLCSNLN